MLHTYRDVGLLYDAATLYIGDAPRLVTCAYVCRCVCAYVCEYVCMITPS